MEHQVCDTNFLPTQALLLFAINFQVLGRTAFIGLVVKHRHGLLLNEFIKVALDESLVRRCYLANLLQHQ